MRPDAIETFATAAPRGVRLFLDDADPRCWERLLPRGIFHGVTTNPLLLARAGQACTARDLDLLARRAGELGAQEIHLQAWGAGAAELVRSGLQLAEGAAAVPRRCIKVPATAAGLLAAAELRRRQAPVTLTAVYREGQVLAAAALDAAYAAPYLGRLLDAGRDGPGIVRRMHAILAGCGSPTRLLVASLRTAEQVCDLAAQGLDTFTLSAALAEDLTRDDLTEAAARAFEQAAAGDDGRGES